VTARCRHCLALLYFSPFVGQWETIPDTICTKSPEGWKTHTPLQEYSLGRVAQVIGDLVRIVSQ